MLSWMGVELGYNDDFLINVNLIRGFVSSEFGESVTPYTFWSLLRLVDGAGGRRDGWEKPRLSRSKSLATSSIHPLLEINKITADRTHRSPIRSYDSATLDPINDTYKAN